MRNLRYLLSALVLCAAPTLAQPAPNAAEILPFPMVSPLEAERIAHGDKTFVFHLRDVTLREALSELQTQSGFAFDTSPNQILTLLDKKLSLDLETRSIGQAMRAMLDEAGVKVWFRESGAKWLAYLGNSDQYYGAPQSGFGPFQIQLQALSSGFSNTMQLAKGPYTRTSRAHSLQINFGVMPEPLLDVSAVRFRLTRVEDDQGHSLLPLSAPASATLTKTVTADAKDNWKSDPIFRLAAPVAGAQKLARIEGIVNYVLPTKSERWEVPDLMNAQGTAHDFQSGQQAIQLLLKSVQFNEGVLEVEIGVTSSQANDFGELDNPLFSGKHLMKGLQIGDAKGRLLTENNYGSSGKTPKLNLISRFVWNNKKEMVGPLKLTLDAPVDFVQTEVPFSFFDVPLP